MKAMICLPRRGAGATSFLIARDKATDKLKSLGYEAVYVTFPESAQDLSEMGIKNALLYKRSQIMRAMSQCDAVYCCKGWENDPRSTIEHDDAEAYGLEIIYEE